MPYRKSTSFNNAIFDSLSPGYHSFLYMIPGNRSIIDGNNQVSPSLTGDFLEATAPNSSGRIGLLDCTLE